MRLPVTLPEIAPRISAGAYILNSGLSKREVDDEHAEGLHGMAAQAFPVLADQEPQAFVRLLSTAEIAIAALLLTPVVPSAVAGAALTGFSGGLLGLYLRTPGARKPGSLAPSPQGIGLAKDVWLLGIGLGLLAGSVERRRRG
jgi:hypothetical protein